MAKISELVRDFIIKFDISQTERDDLYKNILHTKYDPQSLLTYITSNRSILMHKVGHNFFFDFIYNKVIHERGEHPNTTDIWKNILLTSLDLVQIDPDYEFLRENKRYILDLQSNNKSFISIFKHLMEAKFETGDLQFLTYSIIARGELSKFKIIEQYINIDDYPGAIDVALRYGRYQIIEHLLPRSEGTNVDFANYTENFRYLYYSPEIKMQSDMPAVSCALQDYEKSLTLVCQKLKKPVTVETIYIWCDLIRCKQYSWDIIDSDKVLELLRTILTEPVDLSEDFDEYNTTIFGQWGDRKFLVEKCRQLEARILQLEDRYGLDYTI
jgi:hypothetical protein